MFHIFCTFVSQSRAFLSQLSVTGDESVFFMRVRKDTIISFPINFFASAFLDIKAQKPKIANNQNEKLNLTF